MKKVKTSVIVVLVLILLAFISTIVLTLMANNGKRYTFVFPSADSDTCIIENRYLVKTENIVSRYVDELLLGSVAERTKLIFPRGTRVISCFQRGDTLYLDLSKELLAADGTTYPLKSGAELLEKNIKTNFASIKKVEIYVDSKRAWE